MKIKNLILTAFVGAFALCAISCSDDDNNEPANGGQVSVFNGTRLTRVGDYTYSYDSKGRVETVKYNGYTDVKIDYDKKRLYFPEGEDLDFMNLTFNGSGYITSMSSSWNYTDEDGKYVGSGKMTFAYNGDGTLKEVSYSSSETEKDLEDGSTSKYSETGSVKLTWKNGNLEKVYSKTIETEDGDKDVYEEAYTIDYSDDINEYRQWTLGLGHLDIAESNEALMVAGLYGKGPKELPSMMSYSDEDGYSTSYTMRYRLNSNGTIAVEGFGYYSYNYYYEAAPASKAFDSAAKRIHTRDFFVKRKK